MHGSTLDGSSELRIEASGGVVRLVLNRPQKRNALSEALVARFSAALEQIAADPTARAVVIAAEGPVFCSGHDLTEMQDRSELAYREIFTRCSNMMLQLRGLPQPVIARVQGPAIAAGCQLVAACDLAVAADGATFAAPGVKIGLFCTTPMVPLVRAIPAKAALEMLFTGRPISAARALELGLVNRVVPEAALDSAVGELTAAILEVSPLVLRLGKRAFYQLLPLEEREAYSRATDVMVDNALRADAQEGIAAFLAKRKPAWRGR